MFYIANAFQRRPQTMSNLKINRQSKLTKKKIQVAINAVRINHRGREGAVGVRWAGRPHGAQTECREGWSRVGMGGTALLVEGTARAKAGPMGCVCPDGGEKGGQLAGTQG